MVNFIYFLFKPNLYKNQILSNQISILTSSVTKRQGKHTSTKHFYGNEIYIRNSMVLLQPQANQELLMQACDWTYPFSFVLPPNIQSTFSHTVGNITYYIEAHL